MKIDTSEELRREAQGPDGLWHGHVLIAISKHTSQILNQYQYLSLSHEWVITENKPPVHRKNRPLKLYGFDQKGVMYYDQRNIEIPPPEFAVMDLIKVLEAIEKKQYTVH